MKALVLNQRCFATVLLFLCLAATARAQPKAQFSASPTAGCSPLVVYFTDSSSGNPTSWRWDLGNGVTSFLRNPSATYFNPGTYTVKLVVSNTNGSDSIIKKEIITVYAAPAPQFGFTKAAGCFPLPVQFTDSTIAGSGTNASWQWDFGDGTISSQQHPQHTYTAAGNFSVTLRVTNSFGCTNSITKREAIQITHGVKATFSATDPGICPVPATVQFTNNSTGPGPLSYQWSFGDGSHSTAADPTHTYRQKGIYSVSLIATSPQGCVDTIIKDSAFLIGIAKADFSHPSGTCVGDSVFFTNTSSPAPGGLHWDFGDGTFSTQMAPAKTYTQAGMYTIRLIATFGSCSDTVKKLITVSTKPTADFTANKLTVCRLPAGVQFQSLATGDNYQYHWDFGDSTIATTAAPLHMYAREGSYTVRLIVTNDGGCKDTIIKKDLITVRQPRLQMAGLQKKGCVPASITPSAFYSTGQTISSYQWNFGDGTTSTAANPEHLYTKPGTYTIRLVVTTTEGCADTVTVLNAVRLGDKPKAHYIYQPLTACSFDRVYFTDQSSSNTDQWFWDFGDGGTSILQNPVHQFGDTGWYNVRLVAFNNTCPDTFEVKKAVYINPPISIFVAANDCNNKFTKQFKDKSHGAQTWFWEFGDGDTSTEQHPSHTFGSTGQYSVKLTVTNGSCTHYSTRTVAVIDEKAEFVTKDTVICRNGTAHFTPEGIDNNNILRWRWEYGDGTGSSDTAKNKHTYPKAGTYPVSLTITDLLGCQSTKSLPVNVYGPMASFTPSVTASCLPENKILFTDASTSDGSHPIVKWVWSYGNGTVDSSATPPYQYSYPAAGTYTVKLTITDNIGCRDSTTSATPVVIAQPRALFSVSDTVMCTGKNIRFSNASQGSGLAYQWSFGNGAGGSAANPVYAYPATGVYSVKLVVTDRYGCKDSTLKENRITISYPKAAFAVSDTFGSCPPLLVHFTNQSTSYRSIAWDFDDGNLSKLEAPSHFYALPGTFTAKLIATGPGGCTDTARQQIVVKGPSGTFSYKPLSGCKPLTVNFKASTKNNASFIWDFSDGSTVASQKDSISHTYVVAGDFVPKMILTDAGGCSVPIQGKDTIRVLGVTAGFDLNKTTLCDDGTVQFTNQTVSNDLITGYHWSFGDGTTSTATQPSHYYQKPGQYTVQLVVTTQNGCSDKKQLTDTVKVHPRPLVQIAGDTAACAPATFTFSGMVVRGDASRLKWAWDMGNGTMAAIQNPTAQIYQTDGDYKISAIVTDHHGCSDTALKKAVVHPLPKTAAGADHWICQGSFSQLKVTGADTYQWASAPALSCTTCDAPLAAPTEKTQFVVTGYTRFGCSLTDSITINVHQPFTLSVGKGDTICVGKTISLFATGAEQYAWTPTPGVKDPAAGTTTATPGTSTLYTVIAKDNAGCFTDTGEVYIKVWPIPTIKAETEQTLSVGHSLTLKPIYSGDVSSYQWSNAQTLSCATCPAPVAHPKSETTYAINVKNGGGCVAKESITVRVICNDGNLFIPNTFSPNADGRNDRFYPRGTGISSIKSLKVFNRWGEMVFSRENFGANDATAGWDGLLKGTVLSPDVYVYTCEVVCMNNEVLLYRGDVTLLR